MLKDVLTIIFVTGLSVCLFSLFYIPMVIIETLIKGKK